MRLFLIAAATAGLALLSACDRPGADASAPVAEPQATAPVIDADALGIPTDPDSIADGREIALSHCSNCHGVDQSDSLRADAPPLRYVLSLYAPESLAEDFRAGIHVGHEDMPDFVFGDLGMDVLLSYLVSIQEPPPAEE